ncbi:MAG: HipA N-terminal domain-containing protein [Allorhizobium sp.]
MRKSQASDVSFRSTLWLTCRYSRCRRDGRLSFVYATEWLERKERDARHHRLSLSLPFRDERYDHEDAGPFFEGLLPDNNKVREQLARHLRVDARGDFALLYELAADCPLALTILPEVASEITEDRIHPNSI